MPKIEIGDTETASAPVAGRPVDNAEAEATAEWSSEISLERGDTSRFVTHDSETSGSASAAVTAAEPWGAVAKAGVTSSTGTLASYKLAPRGRDAEAGKFQTLKVTFTASAAVENPANVMRGVVATAKVETWGAGLLPEESVWLNVIHDGEGNFKVEYRLVEQNEFDFDWKLFRNEENEDLDDNHEYVANINMGETFTIQVQSDCKTSANASATGPAGGISTDGDIEDFDGAKESSNLDIQIDIEIEVNNENRRN